MKIWVSFGLLKFQFSFTKKKGWDSKQTPLYIFFHHHQLEKLSKMNKWTKGKLIPTFNFQYCHIVISDFQRVKCGFTGLGCVCVFLNSLFKANGPHFMSVNHVCGTWVVKHTVVKFEARPTDIKKKNPKV